MTCSEAHRKQYDLVDVSKLILSIMVCSIHSLGGIEWLRPWLSIAVPMFFTYSGFFFFSKWRKKPSLRDTFLPFLGRTARLYLVWFVIWLPLMMRNGGWFSDGIIKGFLILLIRITLNSTFTGAWYLSALIVGTFLICLLSKRIDNQVILALGFVLYSICVLMSNYRGLFSREGFLQRVFVYTYPGTIYNSFPAGVLFIALGKVLAETDWVRNVKKWSLLSAASLLLLYGEYLFIFFLGCRVDTDCYFLLMIVAPLLAMTTLSVDIRCVVAKECRNLSTINYCMHGGIINLITIILEETKAERNTLVWNLVRFGATEIIVFTIGFLVICLSERGKIIVRKVFSLLY